MPKILTILTNPDPKLRKKSVALDLKQISSKEIRDLIRNMTATMLEKDGVGLAAPQIGKNIRFIVINIKDGPIAIFDPKVLRKSFRKEWGEEGCLSVPNIFGQVKRSKKIICEYYNDQAKKIRIEAEGIMARIWQHEIDHLDGILFIDKAKQVKQN